MFTYIGERNFPGNDERNFIRVSFNFSLSFITLSLRLGLISLIPNITPPIVAIGIFISSMTKLAYGLVSS